MKTIQMLFPRKQCRPLSTYFEEIAVILVIVLATTQLYAQSNPTRIIGSLDSDIPRPDPITEPSPNDIGALSEILAHIKTVGAAPLKVFHATGSIAYAGDSNSAATASLDIQEGNRVRLDVETPDGVRSSRINGRYGATQQPSGKVEFMPDDTALTGMIGFARLRTAGFPCPLCSLADRGIVNINGEQLRRIALQVPFNANASDSRHRYLVTDLYFDPGTHLLTKSAEIVHLFSEPRQDFIRVTSYQNYQAVSGTLIPFKITESLNGQLQWQLELSSAQVNISGTPIDFTF